jgi:hypothetical protein
MELIKDEARVRNAEERKKEFEDRELIKKRRKEEKKETKRKDEEDGEDGGAKRRCEAEANTDYTSHDTATSSAALGSGDMEVGMIKAEFMDWVCEIEMLVQQNGEEDIGGGRVACVGNGGRGRRSKLLHWLQSTRKRSKRRGAKRWTT